MMRFIKLLFATLKSEGVTDLVLTCDTIQVVPCLPYPIASMITGQYNKFCKTTVERKKSILF
jgi:hypothetical protein